MQFDTIQIKQGSSIQNLVVGSGLSFPTSPNDGQLFYISGASGGNTVGLFIYEAVSASWIRQLSATDSISALLPNIVTPGTYSTVTVSAAGLVTAGTAGGVSSLAGSTNVIVSAASGAVTISLPATITSNTSGSAATITGTYAGTLTKLQVTTALGYTPLQTAQTISIAGDAGGSGTSSITLTLNTVNSAIGTFGSSTSVPVITVNGKGLVTGVTTAAISGGNGSLASVTGTANQINSTTAGGAVTLSLPSNLVLPPASTGTALSLSAVSGIVPLGITINSGATTAISVNGPAATNLSVLTFQQSGQGTLLLYNPASTNNINFYNNVRGDVFSILGGGGVIINAPSAIGQTLTLQTSNSAYSGDVSTDAVLLIANSSLGAQSAIDFTTAGSLSSRIRSDYANNLNYIVTGSQHSFLVGGDSGIGSVVAAVTAGGAQVTSLGVGVAPAGAGNIYASGGLAISGGATFGSIITRYSTIGGYLSGNYSSVENGLTAGAIYSIGGSYVPAAGTTNPLSNMYGIGYTTSNTVSGGTGSATIGGSVGSPLNQWGLYVASNGVASIFLNSDNGTVYARSVTLSGTTGANLNSNVSTYGSMVLSGSANGWAGVQFSGAYQLQTFMVSTTANWSGVFSPTAGSWNWYITNGTLTGVSQVNGNASTATLASQLSMSGLTASANYDLVAAITPTTAGYLGNITGNPSTGTLTAVNIVGTSNVTSNSDARLKRDIAPIDDALQKVLRLQGVNFTRIDTGIRGTGLLAQNVQEVVPEAVLQGEYLSIAYGNLVGLLVESIKELTAKVERLERQVNDAT